MIARGERLLVVGRQGRCWLCRRVLRQLGGVASPNLLSRAGKSPSSSRWLRRQWKDPLVSQAASENYRSRAAFKLMELDDKHHFLRRGSIVVDCGARPGSWSQVAAERIQTANFNKEELFTWKHGMVVAVDIEAMDELPGVLCMRCDLLTPESHEHIETFLEGRKADVVMSDMAPNATGVRDLDHHKIMDLCDSALQLAARVLKHGGVFLCKQWQGSRTAGFKSELRRSFACVRECTLKATRKESSETYLMAKDYIPSASQT